MTRRGRAQAPDVLPGPAGVTAVLIAATVLMTNLIVTTTVMYNLAAAIRMALSAAPHETAAILGGCAPLALPRRPLSPTCAGRRIDWAGPGTCSLRECWRCCPFRPFWFLHLKNISCILDTDWCYDSCVSTWPRIWGLLKRIFNLTDETFRGERKASIACRPVRETFLPDRPMHYTQGGNTDHARDSIYSPWSKTLLQECSPWWVLKRR